MISAFEEWYLNASEKEAALLAITNKGPMGGPIIMAVVFFNGDETEGRKRFGKLFELGALVDGTGMIPYEEVNGLQNAGLPYGANYHLTGTLRGERGVAPDVAAKLFNQLIDIAGAPGGCAVDEVPTMMAMWEYFHLKRAASVPADATAFRMRVAHPAVPMMISWKGESPEVSLDAKDRLRRLKQCVEDGLKETFHDGGMGEDDTGYGNYGK